MITLREIDSSNFWDCIRLKIKPEQEHFLASNAVSLAQSKYEPECTPLAIYDDEIMVGFLMYLLNTELNEYCIYRVMTDAAHQGKGCATAGMKLLLERIAEDRSHNKVLISFHPENHAAERVYARLGFYRNGQMWDNEVVMQLDY